MLSKPHILSFSPTCLSNSIKYEHSCEILYILQAVSISNENICKDVILSQEFVGVTDGVQRQLRIEVKLIISIMLALKG